MSNARPSPPPTAAARHERPFAHDPERWEKARTRALRLGQIGGGRSSVTDEPLLVHERTRWGWLAWPVPQDGSTPQYPQQIGVLTPAASRTQRLALWWLTRRPARHIALPFGPTVQARRSTTVTAVIGLAVAVTAVIYGLAAGVALPAMLLAPLLTEHVPQRLDDRARAWVRSVDAPDACRHLQRLASLQSFLGQAAAGSDRYELRRSAEVGRHVLWDAADLLQTRNAHAAGADLAARERLMAQLAEQVAQILNPHEPAGTGLAPDASPFEGHPSMPRSRPASATDVYLLFAHEPYYPLAPQEVNTSLVAAASLLHPQVRQPDGARIHDLLTRGRRPGEIVPLSTLTDELDGGTRWPAVGDWEAVTDDLLHLIRSRGCDALSLGLPATARALICAGPRCAVRARYPLEASGYREYGPADRIKVLLAIGKQLAWAEAGTPLWPGAGLHPALAEAPNPRPSAAVLPCRTRPRLGTCDVSRACQDEPHDGDQGCSPARGERAAD